MVDRKPVIFISHVSEDEAIALYFKEFIEQIFLNTDVFVSGRDLGGGEVWIEELRSKLALANVIIALITPYSIKSNWVHFEAGSGFTRKASIPLLIEDITFNVLAPPFSLLQGRIFSRDGLSKLLNDIAALVGLRAPVRYPGIEELVISVDEFIELRKNETIPDGAKIVLDKKDGGLDERLNKRMNLLHERAMLFLRSAIASRRNIYDLPSNEQLNEMGLSDLSKLAEEVGLDLPFLFANRLGASALTVPFSSDPDWKKKTYQKNLEDLETLIDHFKKNNCSDLIKK